MSQVFQSGLAKLLGMATAVSYLSDTIKSALTKGGATTPYVEDADQDFMGDVTEMPDVSGYAGGFGNAGRQTLGSKTITVDDSNNRVRMTAADAAFGALGIGSTIRGYIALKEVTNDAASPIFSHKKLAVDTPTNGSTITAEYSTTDVFRINC